VGDIRGCLRQPASHQTYSHDHAAQAYVWAQPLAYARELPKHAEESNCGPHELASCAVSCCFLSDVLREASRHIPIFSLIHWARKGRVNVGRCADQKDQDEQERVEVEESGLKRRMLAAVLTDRRATYHDEVLALKIGDLLLLQYGAP